jgi:nitrite reductase/ring-hydroxylating ferredoxin subunit
MNAERGRVRAGTRSGFDPGHRRRVRTDRHDIVVVRTEEGYFAFENNCPHQHFAALHEGTLDGCHLTCPMHGWTFDVRTGRSVSGEGSLRIYSVEVEKDDLQVSVE